VESSILDARRDSAANSNILCVDKLTGNFPGDDE